MVKIPQLRKGSVIAHNAPGGPVLAVVDEILRDGVRIQDGRFLLVSDIQGVELTHKMIRGMDFRILFGETYVRGSVKLMPALEPGSWTAGWIAGAMAPGRIRFLHELQNFILVSTGEEIPLKIA